MNRIDLHAHYVPEFYREALIAAGQGAPDGIKGLPEWSEASAIAAMDRLGVSKSYLSISSPGVYFGDAGEAAVLSRQVNEEAVALRERSPERFGFFASTPVPDIDAAQHELVYALDTLNADGLVLETNNAGVYLGDQRLEPLYAELNRRGSTLFIHPTTPFAGAHLALGYPHPMLEFFFETTRSVTNMILSGVIDRYPDMRVIVPHAGAALPVLANRIELLLPILSKDADVDIPSVKATLRKLHYDLAGAPVPELLNALLEVADVKNIHYGSDYPFTPLEACVALATKFDGTDVLDEATRRAIYSNDLV
ncbi:amidohydrolase family protein [Microbacterium maritypicum]|uniref:amidohydrolase family protein n=1 Tax=Microbacterium maritypicum TaxID=33918 RepID=UPI0038089CFB